MRCLVLHHLAALATAATTTSAAGDKHEDGANQRQDGGDESNVDNGTVLSVASALVDLGEEEAEDDKVNNDSDGVDDKGNARNEGGKDAAHGATGDEAEEEGDEEDAGADGVEDEDVGEGRSRVSARRGKVGVVNTLEDLSRVVAELSGGAGGITTDASGRAVTKYTELGVVVAGQVEVDEGEIVHHRGRDVDHDGKDHGDEEDRRPHIVEDGTNGHCE